MTDNLDNLKIEKNIPIISKRKRGDYYDVLCQMNVGDSIKVNFKTKEALRAAAKRIGIKCTVRKLFDKDDMYRIWRIE